MLFVPLPLFATLLLGILCLRFMMLRDMRQGGHQLFALLIGLYAVQSLLSSLRWGYGIEEAAVLLVLLAPILPAVAYLGYKSLSGPQAGLALWPLAVILVNWATYFIWPETADPMILMTYVGFGVLLISLGAKGIEAVSLSPIGDSREIRFALYLTGSALIASALTDVYIIYDFVRNEGRNTGLILTFVQTAFVLVVGVSGVSGRVASPTPKDAASPPDKEITEVDSDILARLDHLFESEKFHQNEDLSLRRLARRIGVSDRQVSRAINRMRDVSVTKYVNEWRIGDARTLLRDTDRSVLDISLTVGFASKSNFNREFLRIEGCSPSDWRRANRKATS